MKKILGNYVFYYCDIEKNSSINELVLPENYQFNVWKPGYNSFLSSTGTFYPFFMWFFFHVFKIFRNRNYSIIEIIDNGKVIHRSCILPKFFRFPFMGENDLHITGTWTDENYRGKGLATKTLVYVLMLHKNENIKLWYISRQENIASIRVAKKAGFQLFGVGGIVSRFNSRFLGYFSIKK